MLTPKFLTPRNLNDLVLTMLTFLITTTLEIKWSGGDGSNDIQTSSNGEVFSTVIASQASPAVITIDPVGTRKLFVRVIEP